MSVYTRIARPELEKLLANYGIGTLVQYQGIEQGIVNSNYYLDTSTGHYVLTVFEMLDAAVAAQHLSLMQFYADRKLPVPQPIHDQFGQRLTEISGKPAVIVQRMPGQHIDDATVKHCAKLGAAMGELHLQGRAFAQQIQDPHDRKWQRATAARVLPHLSETEATLLQQELEFQNLYRLSDLPAGIVHGDIFRDNVLFDGTEISAVLDWYHACHKVLLYDVAVAANDWCVDPAGEFRSEHVMALLTAYHQQRPLTAIERGAWPVVLRAAALRFWLSRLQSQFYPRTGDVVHGKDPLRFRDMLRYHIQHHDSYYSLWVR